MNHAQFQSHVASLAEQSSVDAVREEAVTIVREWLNVPAVGLYKRIGDRVRLVAATEVAQEWCPKTFQFDESGFKAIMTSGEPVSGEPPPVFDRGDAWCGASTGEDGVLFGLTASSIEFEQPVRWEFSHLAMAVGMACQSSSGSNTLGIEQSSTESDSEATPEPPQIIREAFPDYAFLYDRAGTYLDVVLGSQTTSLHTAEELIGSQIDEVFDPDTAECVQDAIKTTIDTGESQTVKYSLTTPTGDRTFEGNISPVTVEGVGRAVLVARDVTEKERRKSEIAEIRERTEFALETTNSLTWKLDLDTGELQSLRGDPQTVFGEDIETFDRVTEHIEQIVHPEDRPDVRAAFERVTEGTRDELQIEYRAEPGDDTRWISAEGYVREEADGSRCLLGLATDETTRHERKRQLTALHGVAHEIANADSVEEVCRRTITAAEDVLDLSACLISIIDDDMLVPKATSGDVSPDDYEVKPIKEGIAGETYRTGESFLIPDQHAHPVAETTENSPYRSLLSVAIGDHGSFQAGETDVDAFDERDLELTEILGAYAETTLDLLASRRERERKNERLKEFTSLVSHDLRNPLNVAQGQVELANREISNPHLEKVIDAHNRMEALIDDLLTLARTDSVNLDKSSISLGTVASECWSLVDTAQADLCIGTDCEIEADRQQLQRLFENLFRNAVEHGGETVTVTVETTNNGFYVADDGPGIEEDEDRIFDAGYTTATTGTGFGLKIVREIVRSHGWHVTAGESEQGGARFHITI